MITIKTMKDIPSIQEIPNLHNSKSLICLPHVRLSAIEPRRQKLHK
ncbi:hypothetical protein [Floridanema aerugineum]|jgi:hypothetical protein|uniref:Uncharacterized protein n=1 Tax=Floridaenema aerugineum BLCC-F46 TaxID=3153654 RepID=A0ABV4X7N6_9CYAN